jgi:replicative DNA helicase
MSANDALDRAERAVLGSCIRDNGTIPEVGLLLKREWFRTDAHQTIFAAILRLFDDGDPIDLVALVNLLQEWKQIDNVGGYAYLAELWDAAPTAQNVDYYCRIVRDAGICRELLRAVKYIAGEIKERVGPAEQLLESAERRILAVAAVGAEGRTVDLRAVMGEVYDDLDRRMAPQAAATLQTGFRDLDTLTAGLRDSELMVVGARPSVGKTAFALALARKVLAQARPVLFVSLEQRRVELGERLACAEAGINLQKLRLGRLNKEEVARFKEAGDRLAELPLHVDDEPFQRVIRILATARRLKLRQGIRLVVVDYLQMVEADDPRAQRHVQVGAVSRRLKQLARDLAVPVVALAQVNRAVEDRQGQRPRLADLRESGSIEADADTVLLLHQDDKDPNVLEVIVAKQRNGPTGSVPLTFLRDCQKLADHAPGRP